MKEIVLECKDKRYRGEQWSLFLDERSGRLDDSEGETRAIFSRIEAAKRFRLDSFWASGKKLGVVSDDEEMIWFYPDSKTALLLKKWIYDALATQGPKAIRAVWTKGLLCTVVGFALTIIEILFMTGTIERALGIPSLGRILGVAIVGGMIGFWTAFAFIMTIAGIQTLIRANAAGRTRNNRKKPSV